MPASLTPTRGALVQPAGRVSVGRVPHVQAVGHVYVDQASSLQPAVRVAAGQTGPWIVWGCGPAHHPTMRRAAWVEWG